MYIDVSIKLGWKRLMAYIPYTNPFFFPSSPGRSVHFEDEEAKPDSARSNSSSSSAGSSSSLSSASSGSSQGSSSSGATSDSKDDDAEGNPNNNNSNNNNNNTTISVPPSNIDGDVLRQTEEGMKPSGEVLVTRISAEETGSAPPRDGNIPAESEGDEGRVTPMSRVSEVEDGGESKTKPAGSPEQSHINTAASPPPPSAKNKKDKGPSKGKKKLKKKKSSSEKLPENQVDPTIPPPQMQPPVPADWRSGYPPTMNGYPPPMPAPQPYGAYNGWHQPIPGDRNLMDGPRHAMDERQMAAKAPVAGTEDDDDDDDESSGGGSSSDDSDDDDESLSESDSEEEPEKNVQHSAPQPGAYGQYGASVNGPQPGMYDPYGAMVNPGYPDPRAMGVSKPISGRRLFAVSIPITRQTGSIGSSEK